MSAGFGRGQAINEESNFGKSNHFGQSDQVVSSFQNMRVSSDRGQSFQRNNGDDRRNNSNENAPSFGGRSQNSFTNNQYGDRDDGDFGGGTRGGRGGSYGRGGFTGGGGGGGRGGRGFQSNGFSSRSGFGADDDGDSPKVSGDGFAGGQQRSFDADSRKESNFGDGNRGGYNGFGGSRNFSGGSRTGFGESTRGYDGDFGGKRDGYRADSKFDGGDDQKRFGDRSFDTRQDRRGFSNFSGNQGGRGGGGGGGFSGRNQDDFANGDREENRFGNRDSRGGGRDGSYGYSQNRTNDFDDRYSGFRGRSSDFDDRSSNFRSRTHDFGDRSDSRGGPSGDLDDSRQRFESFIPEDRSLEDMYSEDAENAKYEVNDLDLEVSITGIPENESCYRLASWNDSGFSDALLRNVVNKACYNNVRRIQSAIIPLIRNGWDVCGHAETGSGKTAAFILPIIDSIVNSAQDSERSAPLALIMAPTRELVAQIYNQTRKFADGTGVTVAKAYGQYRVMDNINEIMRGCNILIATMGRLKDFVARGKVQVNKIKFFVLDEADRMLSGDSFMTDIMDLLNEPNFPSVENRQTLLFSATFDRDVQNFAKDILKKQHAFVSNGRATAANSHVQQCFVQVSANQKLEELHKILSANMDKSDQIPRTIVFVERKKQADAVALFLSGAGLPCSSTNGDRDQRQREEALRDFRKGLIRILVSTDVCARGIDVKDLEHVINYDLPKDAITYVHRIGRTGRLHSGRATTFIDIMGNTERSLAPEIVRVVEEVQQIAPQFLRELATGMGGYSGDSHQISSSNQQGDADNEQW